MKLRRDCFWLLAMLSLACLTSPAQDNTNQVPKVKANTPVPSPAAPTEITTQDGKVYRGVTVDRIEADGIVIDYRLEGGGSGIAKVKFVNLPENLQRQYGYDPQKAAAFESEKLKWQQTYQRKLWADYKIEANLVASQTAEQETQGQTAARIRMQEEAQRRGAIKV